MTSQTGQCLCGKIKYSLSGPSLSPYYNTICHCLNCQRVTGSAFLTASIRPKEVRTWQAVILMCPPAHAIILSCHPIISRNMRMAGLPTSVWF